MLPKQVLTRAEIGLSELQRNLDTTASELVENQKENLVGRKKLADQTRGMSTVSRRFPFPRLFLVS